MKKLLFILIGITIWYNVETKEGFVYNNNSTDNAAVIIVPSLRKVEHLTIDPQLTQKMGDFLKLLLESWEKELPKSIAIITPVGKTGIEY